MNQIQYYQCEEESGKQMVKIKWVGIQWYYKESETKDPVITLLTVCLSSS